MRISAALAIYSAPKRSHIVASTMPKRCVVAGCDKGSDGRFILFTFPKNPERRAQWSREVAKTRSDWTGPSDHSVLCSLHFTNDSFEASIALTTELGLPAKRRKLKDSAVPSLFPKAADVKAGSMEWELNLSTILHCKQLMAQGLVFHSTIRICGEDVPH